MRILPVLDQPIIDPLLGLGLPRKRFGLLLPLLGVIGVRVLYNRLPPGGGRVGVLSDEAGWMARTREHVFSLLNRKKHPPTQVLTWSTSRVIEGNRVANEEQH